MKKGRIIASALVFALAASSACVAGNEVSAAKKPKLGGKTRNVYVGESVNIKLKNGKKKAKVTWKTSNKKIAKITKKTAKGNSARAVVKGVKKGKAKITAVYKLGKRKTNLTCSITVSAPEQKSDTVLTPPQATPVSTAVPVPAATPTPDAGGVQTPKPTVKPTSKPTNKPKPTPTPTPKPTPYKINPYKVDLSDSSLVKAENGGSAEYNTETKALESNMAGITGFVVMNPAVERKDEYKYVEVTYVLEGGDVNAYLGDKDLQVNVGQEAAGWSGELKLNAYAMGEEVTVCFSAYESLGEDAYINGLKFFNFGDETVMSIQDITFYMDGKKSKPDDFVAHTIKEKEVTIDGVASEDEEWLSAKEYNFTTKIGCLDGDTKTDTSGTVRFMHDADNMYFFVDVKDSSIDNTSANEFEQDGLEILFDEDNCRKTGSGSADWTDNKDGMHYRFTGLDKDSEVKTGLVASTKNGFAGGGAEGVKKTGIDIKYALTDEGYSIEAKIPFAAKKSVGDKVSIDLIIQDCKDGSRINEIYLYNTEGAKSYWNNENADFGTLILGKKADSQS